VRVEGAALRLQPGSLASAFDLGGSRSPRSPPAQRAPPFLRSNLPMPAMRRLKSPKRSPASAAAMSLASGRSTSPMKRRVKWRLSSKTQRNAGLSSIVSINRSRMSSGGRIATNRRCMAAA
jgi:hypothetical protein